MAKDLHNTQAAPDFRMMSFGQNGFVKVEAGDAPTEHAYVAIMALTDTDVTVENTPFTGEVTLTLKAGMTIYGLFQAVSDVTGTIIAYIR